MTLENGIFKITSGNARGIHITASGNNSASIYVGKSLFDTLKDFSDSVVKTNSDIDKKVGRYNSDIADYNEQLTALETGWKMNARGILSSSQQWKLLSAVSRKPAQSSII